TAKLMRTMPEATNSVTPCTTGRSRALMAPSARRPSPGSAKTDSSTMAPATSWPSWMPATVTTGMSALRNAWRPITRLSASPYAPIRQPLGASRAHVVLAQQVEHGRARSPHEHRGLEEPERDRGQQQRAQRRAGAARPALEAARADPAEMNGEDEDQQQAGPEL